MDKFRWCKVVEKKKSLCFSQRAQYNWTMPLILWHLFLKKYIMPVWFCNTSKSVAVMVRVWCMIPQWFAGHLTPFSLDKCRNLLWRDVGSMSEDDKFWKSAKLYTPVSTWYLKEIKWNAFECFVFSLSSFFLLFQVNLFNVSKTVLLSRNFFYNTLFNHVLILVQPLNISDII